MTVDASPDDRELTLGPPKAGDCARHGPHKELPAQGIARTRVVLSRRLACCQSEAARHHISGLYGAVCP